MNEGGEGDQQAVGLIWGRKFPWIVVRNSLSAESHFPQHAASVVQELAFLWKDSQLVLSSVVRGTRRDGNNGNLKALVSLGSEHRDQMY